MPPLFFIATLLKYAPHQMWIEFTLPFFKMGSTSIHTLCQFDSFSPDLTCLPPLVARVRNFGSFQVDIINKMNMLEPHILPHQIILNLWGMGRHLS